MSILPRLEGYDWEQVFQYGAPQVVLGGDCSDSCFQREDVIEILAIEEGENDGEEWIGLFRLKDGRFAYIEAGCDFTGWG